MDLFQFIAAGIIMALAVVVGAVLAALWHSPRGSNARQERHASSRSPGRQSKGPFPQTTPLKRPPPAVRGSEAEKRAAAQGLAERAAEMARLMQDRARIQAAITKGNAKALYELASEYEKLGFHHAAGELSQKAKGLAFGGHVTEHVGPLDRQGRSARRGAPKEPVAGRPTKPTQ
jgi:hypothetical protein